MDELAEDLRLKLKIGDENLRNEVVEKKEENQGEDEEEFSFVCANPDESPVSADEVFDNGQIRPIFPFFDRGLVRTDAYDGGDHDGPSSSLRSPVRKLFVDQRDISSSSSESDDLDEQPEGPYCNWSATTAVEVSPQKCKKSNSTGFSKLWRFRDLVSRSSSDGKDAFLFLNPLSTSSFRSEKTSSSEEKNGVVRKVKAAKVWKPKTASSAHEKHYLMNRNKRESDKRKSYLPYKQDLFGFFTNVNGLSRNVHPF